MNAEATNIEDKKLVDLLNVKSGQLNALLETTKAINDNVSAEDLYHIYRLTLKDQLRVKHLALFMFDQAWKRALWETELDDFFIPIQSNIEKYKSITELNKQEQIIFGGFKYVIPVYHKQQPLAFAL
ncbi:MAG: hypothetical protein KDD21_08595, partial [Bacteroidetes bacterium]|nr:hypothetical protein [Bacteroidota bacterium]